MPTPDALIETAIDFMSQGVRLLQSLPESLYTRQPDLKDNRTIGQHFRQVLEHYHHFCTGQHPEPSAPDTQCYIQEIDTKPESTIGCLRKHIALMVTLNPSDITREELEALNNVVRAKYTRIQALCIQFGHQPEPDFGSPPLAGGSTHQQQQQCAQ